MQHNILRQKRKTVVRSNMNIRSSVITLHDSENTIAHWCHVYIVSVNSLLAVLMPRSVTETNNKQEHIIRSVCLFCLFWVLRRFQHCTGHITTGSWKGRGNQYIEFARVVYCKLPTNGKQLPAFPLEPVRGSNPSLRGGRRECYHSSTMAPHNKKCLPFLEGARWCSG